MENQSDYEEFLGWKNFRSGKSYRTPIKITEIMAVSNNPEGEKSILIKYKLKYGRKPYTMWVYPSDLEDVKK